MDSKKPIFGVILLIALLAIACAVFWNYRNVVLDSKAEKIQEEQAGSVVMEEKHIVDNTAPLKIEVVYPTFAGLDSFNQDVEQEVLRQVDGFKTAALENDAAFKEMDPVDYAKYPRTYDFSIDYNLGQADQDIVSIVLTIESYTGGAHGSQYFISKNYDVKNSRNLQLADLFPGNTNYLKTVSDFAKKDLRDQIMERLGDIEGSWIDDGAAPKEENFSVFLVSKDKIVFYFPQYQVAAYAAGSFTVTMPRPAAN